MSVSKSSCPFVSCGKVFARNKSWLQMLITKHIAPFQFHTPYLGLQVVQKPVMLQNILLMWNTKISTHESSETPFPTTQTQHREHFA